MKWFGRLPSALGILCVPLSFLMLLAGCGGGSTQASLSTDTVNVSLAASSPAAAAPTSGSTAAPPAPSGSIDQVWVTIHRIALLPADPLDTVSGPSPDGEPVAEGPGVDVRGMVSADIPPTEVDLLHLSPGRAARFLNALGNVPAGRYHKIRLFYSDPKVHFSGAVDNTAMRATADFHLDIHFVGGDLVIPVATDPSGGVKVHDVSIVFVLGRDGLKVNVNHTNILMRPQVFARVGDVQYVVTGIADNVDKAAGAFDLATAGGRSFRVEYDAATSWFFRDAVRWVLAGASRGIPALRNGATVDVLGFFDPLHVLSADDVLITLPVVRTGTVVSGSAASGWNADNTLTLALTADNTTVFPAPGRTAAYYDNAVFPYARLIDTDVRKGAAVTARGFAAAGGTGVEAFWISVGP